MESKIVDGVEIIENGKQTIFKISEEQKIKDAEADYLKQKELQEKNAPWYQKIINWFKKHEVKPYFRIKDLADPFNERKNDFDDIEAGSDGAKAAEIGIKITF